MCWPLVMRLHLPAQTHGSLGGFREHCLGKVQGSYVIAPSHAFAIASQTHGSIGGLREHCLG